MFDSTELVTLATSNSLVAFCFCNLIVVILLLSGLKPNSPADQEGEFCAHMVSKRVEKEEYEDIEALSSNVSLVSNAEKSTVDTVVSVAVHDHEDEDEKKDEDGEEDEDELRRRVEEFIEKVNRGWKEEMLRSPPHLERERCCKGSSVEDPYFECW